MRYCRAVTPDMEPRRVQLGARDAKDLLDPPRWRRVGHTASYAQVAAPTVNHDRLLNTPIVVRDRRSATNSRSRLPARSYIPTPFCSRELTECVVGLRSCACAS